MMNGLLILGNISYSSVSCGVQMRHHVLGAADVNDTGFLRSTHSRRWERPQLSDKGIAFICFDGGYFIWVASQNCVTEKKQARKQKQMGFSAMWMGSCKAFTFAHNFPKPEILLFFTSFILDSSFKSQSYILKHSFNIFMHASTSFSWPFFCWVLNKP